MWALVVQVVLYGSYVAVMVFGVFVGYMELVQAFRSWSFRRLVRQRIASCSYEDIKVLAEDANQSRSQVLKSMQAAFRRAVADQAADVSRERIKELIAKHKGDETFAELPENIRAQLISLEVDARVQKRTIVDLANSMGEIYSKNRRDLKRQKRFSFLGLAVGVVGVVVTVFPEIYKGI